jgi:NADPH-dependent 2,4-dienoyl-CoA reductase/sulfur reductase-like enzyme
MEMQFNMQVRIFNEVIDIDKERKIVTIKKVQTGEEYEESYDELILSPGSTPLKPPIPGIESPNIFTLWNIPDVDKIKAFVDKNNIKHAAVIGGGFIGVEMAENFHDLGIEVTIIEMVDQVMAPIDFEMAQIVHQHMRNKSVNLSLGDGVDHFTDRNGKTVVALKSGKEIEADIVMLSIGVRPQTELAKKAGLDLGPRGHIIVDDHLKTSDPYIYAIGDAIEVVDFVNGKKTKSILEKSTQNRYSYCTVELKQGEKATVALAP